MLKHFDREALIWGGDLPAGEKLLLLALNSFVDGNGYCWPGQKTLAEMCGVEERTVRRYATSVAEKGIVNLEYRRKDGKQTSNGYHVNFARLAEFQKQPDKLSGRSSRTNCPPEAEQPDKLSASQPDKLSASQPDKLSADLSILDLSNIDLPSKEKEAHAPAPEDEKLEEEDPQQPIEPQTEITNYLPVKISDLAEDDRPAPLTQSRYESRQSHGGTGQVGVGSTLEERVIEVWNAHKPEKWSGLLSMSPRQLDATRRAITVCGNVEEFLDRLALGLNWVKVEDDCEWFRGKRFRFESFVCDNSGAMRFNDFAGQAREANLNPEAVTGSGLSQDEIDEAKRLKQIEELRDRFFGGNTK